MSVLTAAHCFFNVGAIDERKNDGTPAKIQDFFFYIKKYADILDGGHFVFCPLRSKKIHGNQRKDFKDCLPVQS